MGIRLVVKVILLLIMLDWRSIVLLHALTADLSFTRLKMGLCTIFPTLIALALVFAPILVRVA